MIKLTQEQEQAVKKWAKDGCGLSEIQKNLSKQLEIMATYMDVRFLAIDLKLEIRDKQAASVPQIVQEKDSSVQSKAKPVKAAVDADQSSGLSGSVVVELDQVMKPGSIVSGTVKFSDGVSASWFLDQFGRLALDAGIPDYSPPHQDIQTFQQELRKELEKRGF
jgi:hypothetical protein